MKTHRNPVLMFISGIVFLIGLGLVTLGLVYFHELGQNLAIGAIIAGVGNIIMSLGAIVTGEADWLLLGLLFNN